MREMKQLVLLDADDGYLITVPEGQTGEIEIKLIEATRAEKCKTGKGSAIVCATLDEFIKPATFNEDTDPVLLKKYRNFFRGEWDGKCGKRGKWRISHIRIKPRRILIDVENNSSHKIEVFNIMLITPQSYLKFAINAPNRYNEIETYIVEMSVHKYSGGYNYFLKVTEPQNIDGVCEIVLENGALLKSGAQRVVDDWIPVYVINYR